MFKDVFMLPLWILAIVGAGFLVAAIVIFLKGVSFRKRAILTTGTVSGHDAQTVQDVETLTHRTSYHAIVQYKDKEGKVFSCTASMGLQNSLGKDVGQEVQVYYDPQNPEYAQIKGFWEHSAKVMIFGGVGLLLIIIAMGMMASFQAF